MRVISGTAKGRKLNTLPGLETRPTTDRIKESIFNIIQFDIDGSNVLDLFAGTGQIGIEALSRGAKSAIFVDLRDECATAIRENLTHTHLSDRAKVIQKDYRAFLSDAHRKAFDLIFLDPPYKKSILNEALQLSTKFDILSDHGIIICESGSDDVIDELPMPYVKGKEYRYGSTKITLFTKQEDK
ncbi:MAG: 16S rRNA (guanine(966)-N(2))-methyltransferase RsmD [Clostridiales bacterium]|nr:16S rRNA (guanine(966)-N(2))-methyltransferase RsmD [Clostridiales bacterium]